MLYNQRVCWDGGLDRCLNPNFILKHHTCLLFVTRTPTTFELSCPAYPYNHFTSLVSILGSSGAALQD